jgi:hypothetical protein
MKTFEYFHGKITPGLSTVKDDQYGRVVFLGDANAKPRRIALDLNSPAEIKDGKIETCWPRTITSKRGSFVVLERPLRSADRFMIRVNTSTQSTLKRNGEWESKTGSPKVIAQADGKRQTGVLYCDDIIQMSPGDSIIVRPEGEETFHEIRNERGRMRFLDGRKQKKVEEA